MNLADNYRTLRGPWAVNPAGLPSTIPRPFTRVVCDTECSPERVALQMPRSIAQECAGASVATAGVLSREPVSLCVWCRWVRMSLRSDWVSKTVCGRESAPRVAVHYELPIEKKVPWNGAVSMRSRAGSWETLSICITLHHNEGAPADMDANSLGILIICRFPLA